MKRKYFFVLICILIMLFCTGTVFAMTSVKVINEFETGVVDISLAEYQKNGDKEELWTKRENILPSDKISKIPRIHNNGNDCYVRAKVTFRQTTEINESCIFGMPNDWTKNDDGYYYFQGILAHDKDVELFQGIEIPANLSQENELNDFYIDIEVDAIQAKNFYPKFNTTNPWGNVKILKFEKDGQYDVKTFKASDTKSFQIVYQGDSKNLIKNHDDFFDNFPYLMPGDKYSDSVEIKNNNNTPIKLYFRSEYTEESPLLDKILLKISKIENAKSEIIYSGNLKAVALSENIILGEIQQNEKIDLYFEIEVPLELNNQYSISNSNVTWIFSTNEIEENTISQNPVQTGDSENVLLYISLMIISMILFINRKKVGKDCEY